MADVMTAEQRSRVMSRNRGKDTSPELLQKFKSVFSPGLGCYTGEPISLPRRESRGPTFLKARQVPFALKAKVEAQLEQ